MSLRPFVLLGESDRGFIRERVAAALAAWRGDWLAEEAPEPLLSPRAEPRARRWLVAGNASAGQLALGCRDGWLQRLGALAAAGPEPAPERSPALAAKLGEAMLEALALQLLGALSTAAAPPLMAAPSPIWEHECEAPDWLERGAGGVIHDLWPLLPAIVALSPPPRCPLPARASAGSRWRSAWARCRARRSGSMRWWAAPRSSSASSRGSPPGTSSSSTAGSTSRLRCSSARNQWRGSTSEPPP